VTEKTKKAARAAAITVVLNLSGDKAIDIMTYRYRQPPEAFYRAYQDALCEAINGAEPGTTQLTLTYPTPRIEASK